MRGDMDHVPPKARSMVAKQRAARQDRLSMVVKECERLVDDGVLVTTPLIHERTGIPMSTLQHSPYKQAIDRYRHREVAPAAPPPDPEVEKYRKLAQYWEAIAVKLRAQNQHLMTMMYERGLMK